MQRNMGSLSICCFLRNTFEGPSKQNARNFIGTVSKSVVLCLPNNVHYIQAGHPKTDQGPLGLRKVQLKDGTALIRFSIQLQSFFLLPTNGKEPLEQGQNKLLEAVIPGQAT